MIVSWNWLKEYVDLDMPLDELTDRLTMSGLNLEDVEELAGDHAIDLEVTSNRPDCLGHIGVAREIGTLYRRPIRIPAAEVPTVATKTSELTSVDIECTDLCPQYVARIIRGVKIGPSPDWLKERLEAIGVAPVNNVVDVTNFVLMECGQPLHAFDFDKLEGNRIVVRRARKGEKIVAIDHKEYELTEETCVIADENNPVAIGGVMGGASTEIEDGTVNVLIEVANFQPLSVHHTARMLKLQSPSSYRFERGVNVQQLDWASRRCCELILQTAGGELLDEPVIAGGIPDWNPEPITLRFAQVSRILGIEVPPAECISILERLQLKQAGEATDESAAFIPPPWRRDLTREIDLIEEVARIHGYDQIPEDRAIPVVAATASLQDRVSEKVRQVLTGAGFCEAMTMSFITPPMAGMFTPHPDAAQLEVTPAAGEYGSLLRQTLVPSLLVCRRDNERNGNLNAELYEMARVFLAANPDDPATQPRRLAFVSGRSFAEMRGIVDAIATRLDRDAKVTLKPSDIPQFIEGRGAELFLNGKACGWMGELDRDGALKDLKLREAVTAVELDMQVLTEAADLFPTLRPLPQYPAVSRDLNFILDDEVTWERLEEVVREAGGEFLESVRFVEQYRGKHIPAGKKSYVLSVSYRAGDRTLTGEEVDAAQQQVIQSCEKQLSAALR